MCIQSNLVFPNLSSLLLASGLPPLPVLRPSPLLSSYKLPAALLSLEFPVHACHVQFSPVNVDVALEPSWKDPRAEEGLPPQQHFLSFFLF